MIRGFGQYARTMTPVLRVALVVLCSILAACGHAYRSPGLPPSGDKGIAILEPEKYQSGASFYVVAIDGKALGLGPFNRYELAPGRRSVTVQANPAVMVSGNLTRHFVAKADVRYKYIVAVDQKARQWSFSIVEADSGVRVDSPY